MAVPSRLNTSAEVIADVTAVGIMEDSSGGWSTTLNGAVAEGDTAATLTDGTSTQDGDKFRIGDRPLIEAGVIESGGGTNSLTLQSRLADAYASGEAVVEVTDTPIGDLTEDGIEIAYDGGDTAIQSGTHQGIYVYIPSTDQAITVNFALLNLSLVNIAEGAGMGTSKIAGAGSAVDPYTLDIREENYASQDERVWYFTGTRIDGTLIRVEANSGKVFSPSGSMNFSQGDATEVPFVLRVLHGVRYQEWSA